MMQRFFGLVAVASLAACGATAPQPGANARAKAPDMVPTVAEWSTTVDGAPVPLVAAAAMTQGSSAVTVIFSTQPLPCDAFAPAGRDTVDDERTLSVTFEPRVVDGAITLTPTAGRVDRRDFDDKDALKGFKLVRADVNEPIVIEADVTAVDAADDFLKRPARTTVIKGKAVAAGCGARPGSTLAGFTPAPQPDLKLSYGGKVLAVQGVTISDDALRISTSPLDCKLTGRADLTLKIELPSDLEPKYEVKGSGDVLGGNSGVMLAARPADAPAPKAWFNVEPAAAAAGSPRPVKISGSFTMYDQPVVIEGTAAARVCP